jgi:hypothetical protein
MNYSTDDVREVFTPLLNDAHARFTKRDKPNQEYVRTVFAPLLEAAGRAAGADPSPAIAYLTGMEPAVITVGDVHEAVRKLTAPAAEVSPEDLAAAQAKTAAVRAESLRGLTERGVVLLERKGQLVQRTIESIEMELWEIRQGTIRVKDAESHSGFRGGEKLPGIVWEQMSADNREEILQQELDRRDCTTHGVEYQPPVKDKRSLAYLQPMRG